MGRVIGPFCHPELIGPTRRASRPTCIRGFTIACFTGGFPPVKKGTPFESELQKKKMPYAARLSLCLLVLLCPTTNAFLT
jgi:hypothetical protein